MGAGEAAPVTVLEGGGRGELGGVGAGGQGPAS